MTALAGAVPALEPPDVLVNPDVLAWLPAAARTREPLAMHRKLPGYAPTPLTSCPDLADQLRVAELWVKDESWRLGLPAFKMLGASYACYRVLTSKLGHEPRWNSVGELAAGLARLGPLTLCAATDGNHGRAVARMARLLGPRAVIYVPDGMAQPRIEAIASEGASVSVVAGGYDAAVRRSAQQASDTCIVISDTAWPGYTQIPGWVIEGYSTIFAEISDQLAAADLGDPDVVVIPVGVGALAAAAIRHFKAEGHGHSGALLGVEPESANCVTESMRLNCGTPSQLAAGIVAGETGAAALAGLQAICAGPAGEPARAALRLGPASRVLVLCTEGATDPAAWEQVVGYPVPQRAGQ